MVGRPILFSSPMIRALLDGRKTQTRRLIPQPEMTAFGWNVPWQVGGGCVFSDNSTPSEIASELLRGVRMQTGDRLWVREAWHAARSIDKTPPRDIPRDADIEHAATARGYAEIGLKGKLRPAMFLPRWASRLTLIVTDVRVQRVQEISEEDAKAEGAPDWWRSLPDDERPPLHSAIGMFRTLWDSINADRGFGWDANPWVVAVTFRVIKQNIDQIAEGA